MAKLSFSLWIFFLFILLTLDATRSRPSKEASSIKTLNVRGISHFVEATTSANVVNDQVVGRSRMKSLERLSPGGPDPQHH
ncbi:unnamed protein product [Cochlearia groenlandica]